MLWGGHNWEQSLKMWITSTSHLFQFEKLQPATNSHQNTIFWFILWLNKVRKHAQHANNSQAAPTNDEDYIYFLSTYPLNTLNLLQGLWNLCALLKARIHRYNIPRDKWITYKWTRGKHFFQSKQCPRNAKQIKLALTQKVKSPALSAIWWPKCHWQPKTLRCFPWQQWKRTTHKLLLDWIWN